MRVKCVVFSSQFHCITFTYSICDQTNTTMSREVIASEWGYLGSNASARLTLSSPSSQYNGLCKLFKSKQMHVDFI